MPYAELFRIIDERYWGKGQVDKITVRYGVQGRDTEIRCSGTRYWRPGMNRRREVRGRNLLVFCILLVVLVIFDFLNLLIS